MVKKIRIPSENFFFVEREISTDNMNIENVMMHNAYINSYIGKSTKRVVNAILRMVNA